MVIDLDTLIEVAQEQGITREQLEQRVQERYFAFLVKGEESGIEEAKILVQYIRIPISDETCQKVYAEQLNKAVTMYDKQLDKARGEELHLALFLTEFERTLSALNTEVSSYTADMAYETLAIAGRFGGLIELKKEINIAPSQDLVNRVCEKFFNDGNVRQVQHLELATGLVPGRDAYPALLKYIFG